MAKVYDPIMCMMVDEPTKAKDAKAYSVSYRKGNGPYQSIGVMANSESEAIEKFKKHLSNKKQEAEIFGASIGESLETMKMKGKPVLDDRTIDEAKDSASVLDEAIKTCDGMFQQIFGKYSSAAKQHYDRAVKELDSFKGEIKDYLTLAGKWEMQIRNDLTRIDEAYNTAGNDYYAARREIQETMDSLTQVMLRKAREKRK